LYAFTHWQQLAEQHELMCTLELFGQAEHVLSTAVLDLPCRRTCRQASSKAGQPARQGAQRTLAPQHT
jgi:hypothetical protein